jgi:glyoxylase-like metal-dependent hydrolase (beta-lactamase superfamily II)
MKIIPLSEGAFTIDKTKLFIPFDLEIDELRARNPGSLLVEVQPFAVSCAKDILLLDTGLGFEKNGLLQVNQNLLDAGIRPEQVTKILISHLHKDHAGGVGKMNPANGQRELSFPNARYYIQKKELEYAFEKGFPSYIPEELQVLKDNRQLVLVDGNGTLDGYIRYELTGAHCPYHQVFWIMESGETVFFGGDVAPQIQQMKNRIVAKYDFDGKKCMELRQQWWMQGEKEGWTFLFYHDIKTPIFNNQK